jgi:hypothetical protein
VVPTVELITDFKAAKALGITGSITLVGHANQVIEGCALLLHESGSA